MNNARILIVEDEAIIAMDLRSRLTSLGYTVVDMAASGEEAIRLAEQTRPDLVLMDVVLKGELDGIRAAEQIRGSLDLPVVYSTAHSDATTVQRAKSSEPYGYILKPFETRDLYSAIEMALVRHDMERRLRVSEATARTLMSIRTDSALLVDAAGTILDANATIADKIGKRVDELVGTSIWDQSPLNVSRCLRSALEEVERTGQALRFEDELQGMWFDTVVEPIRDPHGTVTRVAIVARDISDRKRAEVAALRAKEEWEQTFDAVPDLIMVLDPDRRIARINKAMAERLHSTPEECVGRPCHQVVHDTREPPPFCPFARLLEDGLNHEAEITEPRLGGTFVVTTSALYGKNGQLSGCVHVAHDITARKRAEDALRESERKFRGIVEQSSDAIVMTDEGGSIVEWNRRAEEVVGLKRAEALGRPLWDVQFQMCPEERRSPTLYEQIKAVVLDLLETRQSPWLHQIQEVEIQRLDGTRRMLQTTMFALQTAQGLMLGSIMRDATERKQAEGVLARHDREMAALYETSLEVGSQPDLSSLLHAIVRRASQLLGARMGGLYLMRPDGQTLELVVSYNLPRDYTGTLLLMGEGVSGRVAQTGRPVMIDDHLHWDQRAQAFADTPLRRVLGVPLKVGDRVVGVINVTDDQVTGPFEDDQIRLLNMFADQAAIAVENARLVDALRQSNDELKTRNEELDAFAHSVAHDLTNPVGLMLGYAETLVQDHDAMSGDQRLDSLQTIARNARRMKSIIEELLLLAEVRKARVTTEPLDMSWIVSEALQRLADMVEQSHAEIVVPDAPEWPVALGYTPWVEEVWVNYLSNALKYGGHPPHIELGAELQPEAMVRFWLRDNGTGISPEAQARLFTPFTRLDQVHVKGYGLGLSIVRRIVEKLGGQIGVESQSGQGSVFSFTLPAWGGSPMRGGPIAS